MNECLNAETVAVALLRENFEQLSARSVFSETVPVVFKRDESVKEACSA